MSNRPESRLTDDTTRLTRDELIEVESSLKWGQEIDHGETLKLANMLMAMLLEVRAFRASSSANEGAKP